MRDPETRSAVQLAAVTKALDEAGAASLDGEGRSLTAAERVAWLAGALMDAQAALAARPASASPQPQWDRFSNILREFLVQASYGNTIAGAKAALDRFDEIERRALTTRKGAG